MIAQPTSAGTSRWMVWTGTFAKDVISVQLFGDLRKAFEKIRKDPHIGVSEIRRLYRATFSRPTQNELANSIQEMAYLPESLSLKFNSQFFKFHFQRVRRPSDGVREHELSSRKSLSVDWNFLVQKVNVCTSCAQSCAVSRSSLSKVNQSMNDFVKSQFAGFPAVRITQKKSPSISHQKSRDRSNRQDPVDSLSLFPGIF